MKNYIKFLEATRPPKDADEKGVRLREVKKEDFDEAAWSKIKVAMIFIGSKYGFFSALLTKLNIKQAPRVAWKRIKTMATDGISIYYNPNFVHSLTANQIVFVLCHEIMHCAMRHMFREKGLNTKNHRRWNEAGDYAINTILFDPDQEDKATMCVGEPIPCMLWDKQFQGKSAEAIYKELEKGVKGGFWSGGQECGGDDGDGDGDGEDPDMYEDDEGDGEGEGQGEGEGGGTPGPGKGKGKGKGSGKGGQGSATGTLDETFEPGELQGGIGGRDAEEPMGGDDVSKENIEKEWKNAVNNAKPRGAGKGPAVFGRALDKLNKPQLNWKTILKKYLKEILDQTEDKPWTRRFISGRGPGEETYIPGEKEMYGMIRRMVIGVDTSGSISDDELAIFASEMKGIMVEYSVKSVDVLPCDAKIHNAQHFTDPKKTKITKARFYGGGGTSFDPVFKWIEDNMIKKGIPPDIVIYFTDGYPGSGSGPGGWPSKNKFKIKSYENDIIWVITNDRTNNIKVPFGRRLDVDTDAMHY